LMNLQRASHHYEFVIEKGEGKLLGEALFELSELLDMTPTLSKKYNAFNLLVRAADEGHQRAQHKLSVVYATGVGHSSLVPMDSSRSLLLEYMSALSGDVEAAMGMGYRLLNGIGVTASCELALPFYELSANHAAEFIEIEGYVPFVDRMKVSCCCYTTLQKDTDHNIFSLNLAISSPTRWTRLRSG
jgi:TPR repeat protein